MRRRRFICIRLSNPYMTCSSVTPFNRGRSPPQLLTEAAPGCLKPPPTRGLRRAHLHLSYSTTLARLLDTTCHTTVHAGPHTAVQRVTHRHRTGEVDQANQSKRWEAQDTGPDCSPDAKGREDCPPFVQRDPDRHQADVASRTELFRVSTASRSWIAADPVSIDPEP